MERSTLIYGAYGFSAGLILQRLRGSPLPILLGGRDPGRLLPLGERLGLPVRAFALDSPEDAARGLAGVGCVLHAAGPYKATSAPMISACLAAGADYLDLSGEWPTFADALARDQEARDAGVMLMPGAAFSIVPTDCLLAHAARTVPATRRLRLALSRPHAMSRGSLTSALGLSNQTGLVREGGTLRPIPGGSRVRAFDFGEGGSDAVAVAWPDLVTAFVSTGVGDIETYTEAPLTTRATLRVHAALAPLLDASGTTLLMRELARNWPESPPADGLARAGYVLVAEAEDRWRRSHFFRMRTDDGYSVTARIAARIIERVATGERRPGFVTPSALFGTGFAEGLGCGMIEIWKPSGGGRCQAS
ncbi:saccharopine dehydrogenase family protein [Thermaurantiacus sp.]